MRESTTYVAILEEGEAKEARKLFQLLAKERFGPANEEILSLLDAVMDVPRLERMVLRAHEEADRDDLLATPCRGWLFAFLSSHQTKPEAQAEGARPSACASGFLCPRITR